MTNSLLFGISIFVYFFSMVLYVSYLAFRSESLGKVATSVLLGGGRRRNRGDTPAVVRILPDGDRQGASDESLRIPCLFRPDDRDRLPAHGEEIRHQDGGGLCDPLPFSHHGLRLAESQRNSTAGSRPAEQLAHFPCGHVLHRVCGLCRIVRRQLSVPLQGSRRTRTRKIEKGETFLDYLPESDLLDEVGYKTIAIGFPLLTIGIITGAFWANVAWGTYWSWDPKETWSLIVWLIYAAYLHARITRGWKGKKAALLSIVGFSATLFCYLGVNLVLSGLHSYGGAS